MSPARILVVDDDEVVRIGLREVLGYHGFDVTVSSSVAEALREITTSSYDVLLSDLHMPAAGDGLTLVSAMRHASPNAVTILLSAYPEMQAASRAIISQADEVLLKSVGFNEVVDVVRRRLEIGNSPLPEVESVATILERNEGLVIELWYERAEKDEFLKQLPLSREARTGYLTTVLREVVARLRVDAPLGSKVFLSDTAREHGSLRRKQGYSAAMMVEESRMLQVSIFETLQKNLATIDFSILLVQVMTIADEVDSQLAQAVESFHSVPTRFSAGTAIPPNVV